MPSMNSSFSFICWYSSIIDNNIFVFAWYSLINIFISSSVISKSPSSLNFFIIGMKLFSIMSSFFSCAILLEDFLDLVKCSLFLEFVSDFDASFISNNLNWLTDSSSFLVPILFIVDILFPFLTLFFAIRSFFLMLLELSSIPIIFSPISLLSFSLLVFELEFIEMLSSPFILTLCSLPCFRFK